MHPYKRFFLQKKSIFPTNSDALLQLLRAAAHPEEMGPQIYVTDIDFPDFFGVRSNRNDVLSNFSPVSTQTL